jgi:hypothetical protein
MFSRHLRHLLTPVGGLNFTPRPNRRGLFQLTAPRTRALALQNKLDSLAFFRCIQIRVDEEV